MVFDQLQLYQLGEPNTKPSCNGPFCNESTKKWKTLSNSNFINERFPDMSRQWRSQGGGHGGMPPPLNFTGGAEKRGKGRQKGKGAPKKEGK